MSGEGPTFLKTNFKIAAVFLLALLMDVDKNSPLRYYWDLMKTMW